MPQPQAEQVLAEMMNETYDEALLKCLDITERHDFYGIVADHGMNFFGDLLGLTQDSHILELCSGIGGPARYFAKKYGCRVTGIDLSEFNHKTAQARTKQMGLGHLVTFLHANALEITLAPAGFTHVFGCEGLCYFHDKLPLYQSAYEWLKPGGKIAFLESACETPVQLRTEELLGDVQYESIAKYTDTLKAAGFLNIEHHDTTALASKDVAAGLHRLISRRPQVIASAGEEVYFGLLEVWAEFLANFSEGTLTHCGFIAQRP